MSFSEIFIRRPVATALLSLALLLAGIGGYWLLPVAPLPRVEFPTISVGAGLPGASPEVMASSVAAPLERQFGRIAGLTEMTSSSSLGSTNITLQFALSRNINGAARDVQAAINAATANLPADLPMKPTYREVNPANAPALLLVLSSPTLALPQIYDAADSVLAQKIAQVPDVGEVFVSGAAQPAVRVTVNPARLASYGLSLLQVQAALSAANVNLPKGMLWNGRHSYTISANDQQVRAAQYRGLVVSYRNGSPVLLKDIGTVRDSVLNTEVAGLANGHHAVIVFIVQQPGANIVRMVDRIKALLPSLQAAIPAAIHMRVFSDRSLEIRSSVRDVEWTLLVALVLVVLVIFFFLRNPRATAIPSIALPLSVMGTLAFMYLLGYSLDNLSLMALTISTGFVVDDAIVVIENIDRYLDAGDTPFQAALHGAREIGFTVLSMSTSLIAVFIPVLLMRGIVGRLFREFAVTLSVAILVSLWLSLTTTPMLCAHFLQQEKGRRHNWLYRAAESGFERLRNAYAAALRWVLRHAPLTLAVTIATAILTVYLYIAVPKGFFPQEDTGRVMGMVQAEQDISFHAMARKQKQLVDIVLKNPAVKTVASFTGGGGGLNIGRMFIQLKPLSQRKISSAAFIAQMRPRLTRIPGVRLFMQPIQDINIGGRLTGSQYQYTLEDDNLTELRQWSPRILAALRKLPMLRDVNTDQQYSGLELRLIVNRSLAARLGVPMQSVDRTLYDAFGQAEVSTIYTGLNQYHVVLTVPRSFRRDPGVLSELYVPANSGTMIPLKELVRAVPSNTALQVNHQGQLPAVTLSFNLARKSSLGAAVTAVTAAEARLHPPPGLKASFAGTAQQFQVSLANEPYLIAAALIAVYLVLGILYESYIHPITILSTLPSAGVGALLALLVFHLQLTVIALIGILLLIGIVKKNAIIMIDFALDAERKKQRSPDEAIYEAAVLRFRPILMTTLAAMFGALPLAVGTGMGSEFRQPLGVTIVGGLLVSQLLTLFTTPVIYLYMDRLRLWALKHRRVSPPIPAPAKS